MKKTIDFIGRLRKINKSRKRKKRPELYEKYNGAVCCNRAMNRCSSRKWVCSICGSIKVKRYEKGE